MWVNYNDLTATSLGIMVNKGNHPKLALFQVSELLSYPHIIPYIYIYYHNDMFAIVDCLEGI